MKTTRSSVPFNYTTIAVTRSRIAKGLLAIPVSLSHRFPRERAVLEVFLGDDPHPTRMAFSPHTSRSGECRLSGMGRFYARFGQDHGDEVVIQFLENGRYRILSESQFEQTVRSLEERLDDAETEEAAGTQLSALSKAANVSWPEALRGEYYRLSQAPSGVRKRRPASPRSARESAPPSLRKLLGDLYGGTCQVTGFGFLAKNGKPYFETHHIRPECGNHVKNILVVSPNTHAQFTHARVEEQFDGAGWLRRVRFNKDLFQVHHVIDSIRWGFTKEAHFTAAQDARCRSGRPADAS